MPAKRVPASEPSGAKIISSARCSTCPALSRDRPNPLPFPPPQAGEGWVGETVPAQDRDKVHADDRVFQFLHTLFRGDHTAGLAAPVPFR